MGAAVQASVVHGGVHVHPSPDSIVPRQLPAAPDTFVGRLDELAALDQALDAMTGSSTAEVGSTGAAGATVMVSAIGGAGGIGKTWLAVRWANRRVDRFPDGQLFVDLHGFSPAGEPITPGMAMRGFLNALGVEAERIPEHLDAQAALYRSLIAGKRMLVMLDNAATASQVIPLLPGTPSCTVLVTSRSKLDALIDRYGARHLQLATLAQDEALGLLAGRLGPERVAAEPEATEELISLCGRYPLALSIMARHAHTRPAIPLHEFAAELRVLGLDMLDNDTDPAASLPTVLSWSLRGLTLEQWQVFTLLGIAPGPDITIPAATSLAGVSMAHARKMLQALEDASLLERHPNGRYAMHDLIRGYAATASDSTVEHEREAALRRVVDFYLHAAHGAHGLLDPHAPLVELDPPAPGVRSTVPADVRAALAWLDTEHAHLLAAQHIAAAHGWHRIVWCLAWTLDTFHTRRGYRHDKLATWQAALDAATHLPDPTFRSRAHRFIGDAHSRLGQHEEATRHLRQALVLAEEHDDHAEQAHTHRQLAIVVARQPDYRTALHHAEQALALYRACGLAVWEALELNAVGWYTARLGNYDIAHAQCQAALALHRHHHNVDGEAHTLGSLGWIDSQTGHHQRAINYYRQAVALFLDQGDIGSAVDILGDLGHPHVSLGQTDDARTVWSEARDVYRRLGRETDAQRLQRQLDALDRGSSVTRSPLR